MALKSLLVKRFRFHQNDFPRKMLGLTCAGTPNWPNPLRWCKALRPFRVWCSARHGDTLTRNLHGYRMQFRASASDMANGNWKDSWKAVEERLEVVRQAVVLNDPKWT